MQGLWQLTLASRAPDFGLRYNCGYILMGAIFAWLEQVLLKLYKFCFILKELKVDNPWLKNTAVKYPEV